MWADVLQPTEAAVLPPSPLKCLCSAGSCRFAMHWGHCGLLWLPPPSTSKYFQSSSSKTTTAEIFAQQPAFLVEAKRL